MSCWNPTIDIPGISTGLYVSVVWFVWTTLAPITCPLKPELFAMLSVQGV